MPDRNLGKVFPDGEMIFRQGDVADCLYIILSGKVVMCREKDGKEVTLAELGKGDVFGEGGFFMDPVRTESARSLGEARVITADNKFVLKKFKDDPSFAFHIIETMAQHARKRTEELEKTVEDLHLHQEELAADNRELREGQKTLEKSRDKYTDLYDFAPVGYIDVDETGIIRGINLTGAAMLGTERKDLLGLPFASFFTQENQDVYRDHLLECKRSSEGAINEMVLNTKKGIPTKVQIFSYPKEVSGKVVYRTVMTDFTTWKQTDEDWQAAPSIDEGQGKGKQD
ncbi:MAG: cyclic nucleotide-binding domain-containing protein [Syntrophaceae bacterium]